MLLALSAPSIGGRSRSLKAGRLLMRARWWLVLVVGCCDRVHAAGQRDVGSALRVPQPVVACGRRDRRRADLAAGRAVDVRPVPAQPGPRRSAADGGARAARGREPAVLGDSRDGEPRAGDVRHMGLRHRRGAGRCAARRGCVRRAANGPAADRCDSPRRRPVRAGTARDRDRDGGGGRLAATHDHAARVFGAIVAAGQRRRAGGARPGASRRVVFRRGRVRLRPPRRAHA